MYKAKEDSECCTRLVCGPNRPFDMQIFDNAEREVMIVMMIVMMILVMTMVMMTMILIIISL